MAEPLWFLWIYELSVLADMNCIKPGHKYKLDRLDGTGFEELNFVDRGHGSDSSGTNNQDVIRVLIDRVKFLEKEKHWHGNSEIIMHLKKALVLHECRHMEILTERGTIEPESIETGKDGHFIFDV